MFTVHWPATETYGICQDLPVSKTNTERWNSTTTKKGETIQNVYKINKSLEYWYEFWTGKDSTFSKPDSEGEKKDICHFTCTFDWSDKASKTRNCTWRYMLMQLFYTTKCPPFSNREDFFFLKHTRNNNKMSIRAIANFNLNTKSLKASMSK